MSDGQDKSDDLIAELAKLMASTAGGPEPEAKPAPKLVTLADEPRPAGAGPSPVRIPGMDSPAAPLSAQAKPAAPPVLRIPGMDQPVTVSPPPVAAPQETKSEPKPEPKSFDFGTLPPASSVRPEPMANWQDREIPKPVAVRPAPVSVPAPASPEPSIGADIRSAPAAGAVTPEVQLSDAQSAGAKTEDLGADEPKFLTSVDNDSGNNTASRQQPAGDSFDFDFGFGSSAPPAIDIADVRAVPGPSTQRVPSGDLIADLIAAELDGAETGPTGGGASAAEPKRPVLAPPPPRPAPIQQRPLTSSPVAPTVTSTPPRPPVSPPMTSPALGSMSRPADPDRAVAAPVFGNSRPAAPAEADRDPMEEIESLIGEAVRVELNSADKPRPASPQPASQGAGQAPVVPPLTTGFAPRRAALKDNEPQISSAEAAILEAAAAVGTAPDRIGSDFVADASPYKRPRARKERQSFISGGMRQYVGMAVAGTLLLASGFGLYWVLGMGGSSDTDAPVLQADATPVKETPPAAPASTETQGSVVFNEIDGTGTAEGEQLVSRDDSTETPIADVARTVGDETEGASESELANRKVRTVTVRPDGTIVSGDEAVAGNEVLPVDRPNVPDLPGADVQPSELLAAVAAGEPAPAATATATPGTDALSALVADIPVNPDAVIDPSIVAPVPMARPGDRSTLGGGTNARVATTAPAASAAPVELVPLEAPAPAAAAPVSTAGGAYVQLSSQRSEADAQAALRTTQNRLGGSLGGGSLEIRRVDLGAKGIWHRVVLPTGSFQNATQTCASFKANGVDCVAING